MNTNIIPVDVNEFLYEAGMKLAEDENFVPTSVDSMDDWIIEHWNAVIDLAKENMSKLIDAPFDESAIKLYKHFRK